MLYKRIEDFTIDYIQQLVTEQVAESKNLDYKRELPLKTEESKINFLKDITAFANTDGGFIIYGVSESKGIPGHINGLTITNPDEEKRRLHSWIEHHLEPRVNVNIVTLAYIENKHILVLYVEKSFIAPHRFKIGDKYFGFYGRGPARNFELDTLEVRQAFVSSESLTNKVNQFVSDRIIKIHSQTTPITIQEGATFILHIVPVSAFTSDYKISQSQLNSLKERGGLFPPAWPAYNNSSLICSCKITLEGLLTRDEKGIERLCRSYSHFYRNGIIESVLAYPLHENIAGWSPGKHSILPVMDYEKRLVKNLTYYLSQLKAMDIFPPFFIFLSLVSAENYCLAYNADGINGYYPTDKIDRNIIQLPSEIIENFDIEVPKLLKSYFDALFNACGLPGSVNYDHDGNWKLETGNWKLAY